MIRRLIVIVPLTVAAFVVASMIVLACRPDPNAPVAKVVIVTAPSPKSLVRWWELDQTTQDNAAYNFARPHKDAPFTPVAFYVDSETPENLIAARESPGRLRWGPMALDTPYEVQWRGLGEVHLRVPDDATAAQVAEWTAEVERCEPGAKVVVVTP